MSRKLSVEIGLALKIEIQQIPQKIVCTQTTSKSELDMKDRFPIIYFEIGISELVSIKSALLPLR